MLLKRIAGLTGVLACLSVGAPALGQTPAASPVTIDVSNFRLRTNVSAAIAGAQLLNRGTDALVDRIAPQAASEDRWRGRFVRGLKLMAVDLPLVALSHTLGHEAAHVSRIADDHLKRGPIQVTQWPWPVPFMSAGIAVLSPFDTGDPRRLAHFAAGDEAGAVRDRLIGDTIMATGRLDYFTSAQLIYSRLETPGAMWAYLGDSTLRTSEDLFGGRYAPADPREFLITFETSRRGGFSITEIREQAARMRHQSLIALADLQLWDAIGRTATYLASGVETGPMLAIRVGSARLLPRATYALTAKGIARGGQTLILTPHAAFDVSVTATQTAVPEGIVFVPRQRIAPSERTIWDGSVRVRPMRPYFRIAHIEVNVWQQHSRDIGGSAEVGVATPLRNRHTSLDVNVGYKTAGYLAGAPDRANWFAGASVTIR